MHHHEIATHGLGHDVFKFELVRRRVDKFGVLDQRCRLGQPGGEPEGLDLAAHLIARAGAAIESVEGWRL